MKSLLLIASILATPLPALQAAETPRPNIILVMTDDQGWGETSYNGHPILKTPNLDAMAANGLRFDRFYAAPNCSPSRASVLTGRSNDRTAVLNHGHALRRQEKTLPAALQKAGYATAHFGKWHINGYSGPGAPVLAKDPRSPGVFGFDEWYSVTNFFDRDPLMSRNGQFEEVKGDSSEVIVAEALKFIEDHSKSEKPFFTVIWFGSPHDPFIASEEDKAPFKELSKVSQEHYGELVAMDRSIGTLRAGLRKLNLHENTIVWFNSDNGGLNDRIKPGTVGNLRGFKNSVFEGGLRVPCVIEWPAGISEARRTSTPAGIVDIFPTLAEITHLPEDAMLKPIDGISLLPLFTKETGPRKNPLYFRHTGRTAIIDHNYKLLNDREGGENYQLYDLAKDQSESQNLIAELPKVAEELKAKLAAWNQSVDHSLAGGDLPEGVKADPVQTRSWTTAPEYAPYIEGWKDRPEFKPYFKRRQKNNAPKK